MQRNSMIFIDGENELLYNYLQTKY